MDAEREDLASFLIKEDRWFPAAPAAAAVDRCPTPFGEFSSTRNHSRELMIRYILYKVQLNS